jgi:hypothetical protein
MEGVRTGTINDLARAVINSDFAVLEQVSAEQIQKILDTALRTVIGLNCLAASGLDIDLGNGHVMSCTVKKIVGPLDV